MLGTEYASLTHAPAGEGVKSDRTGIFDLNGRLIENISLNEGPGISELNFIEHTSGIYLVKIQLDGYTAATTKFILTN